MATKGYAVEVPLRLYVEADSIAEARQRLRALWCDCSEHLPVGAGCFEKDHTAFAFLLANVKLA